MHDASFSQTVILSVERNFCSEHAITSSLERAPPPCSLGDIDSANHIHRRLMYVTSFSPLTEFYAGFPGRLRRVRPN